MKKISQFVVGSLFITINTFAFAQSEQPIKHGFYLGLGGGWTTNDETFSSTLYNNIGKSAEDHYNVSQNRLTPLVQLGYWAPFCNGWLWGLSSQWEYINYRTPTDDNSRGQHIPNATFSSINFFGPDIDRDFTSQTRANNEFITLLYIGKQISNGYAYLGLGPALFSVSNSIFVSSVHTPHVGNIDNLTSTSTHQSKTLWGAAAQVGFNYFLNSSWFFNLNYTYSQSGKYNFNNSENAALLNGATSPGLTPLNLNRSIYVSSQAILFSINKILI